MYRFKLTDSVKKKKTYNTLQSHLFAAERPRSGALKSLAVDQTIFTVKLIHLMYILLYIKMKVAAKNIYKTPEIILHYYWPYKKYSKIQIDLRHFTCI